MNFRVRVTVDELSGSNVKIRGGDPGDVTLAPTQTRLFTVPQGGSLTMAAADLVDATVRDAGGGPLTDISEGNHGNPNGIVSAAIGPKIPKPGGETAVVSDEAGGMREVTAPGDPAAHRAAGGPEGASASEAGTPGPKPAPVGVAPRRREDAAATPGPRTTGRVASKKSGRGRR